MGPISEMDETKLTYLLEMYPVSALREAWATKKAMRKEELIAEVIARVPQNAIFEFCRIHHPLTKQRILLFENLRADLSAFPDPLVDFKTRHHFRRTSSEIEEFYILTVAYEAIVGPPYAESTFEFPWPVSMIVDSKFVIVKFTIIEKNLSPYLPPGKSALNVHKVFTEETVCSRFIQRLDDPAALARCDIHRGVKALWEAGDIDSEQLRWKSAKSTDTKTMDTKFLMKRDDPTAFQRAIDAPLLKSVFQSIMPDKKYPPVFAVVPADGEVIINRYSNDFAEADNVVRAILAAN